MKQSPEDMARLWVAQFDERLGWLDTQLEEFSLRELVAVMAALEERNKQLGAYIGEMRTLIASQMADKGVKEATTTGLDDRPLHVQSARKPRRTNIDREALIAETERKAATNRQPNVETGEIEDIASAILRTLKATFRFEPRWTEISKLGIDSDEYCETTWSNQVTITEGTEL